MFTGIIQGRGRLLERRTAGSGMTFGLEADFDLVDPREGESIAVNGVCLTAIQIQGRRFSVNVSPETLSRTNLGRLSMEKQVNLERALMLSDRLGGHLVSGHIDGAGALLDRQPVGDFVLFSFALPMGLSRYVIEKGSIAVDGVSLTVNACNDTSFSVSIIPHTLVITTLGLLKKGDLVNIEVDLIGKYVARLLMAKEAVPTGRQEGKVRLGINPAFLAEHGFLLK